MHTALRRLPVRGLVLAIACLVPTQLSGQLLDGRVTGRALDARGAPAIGVRIEDAAFSLEAVTGTDGAFVLPGLRPDLHQLRITYPDGTGSTADVPVYEDETTRVTIRAGGAGGTGALRVDTDPAAPRATVRALDGDVLRSLPVDAVGDALLLIPGLAEPEQYGAPALRGGGPAETAVWLDGVPLRTGGGRAFGIGIAPNALDGITVRTGPLPAPFGDAQAGVISLVSRTAGTRWQGDLRYATDDLFGKSTSIGFNRLEGTAGGPLARGISLFSAGTLERRGAQAYGPGLENVAAFVPSGIDTVVTETLFDGSTRQVTIPSFARATGSCESADNGGRSCEGRRLPYDWSTDLSLSGNVAWRYGRGSSLRLTVVGHAAQDRFWPGALSFNPAAYAGRRTAGTAWILAWRHALGAADGAPIVQVAASRQTARTTSGPLDPAWELSHRDPALGIALEPMEFLVNVDRFSADTGAGAVIRLASDDDWDRLIQNVVTNSGTRVPYLDRNDLRLTQPYRMNPWAAATGFPTAGLAGPLEVDPSLASESHWIGRAVVTVPVAGVHRVRAGADVTRSRVRAFSSALISQSFMSVYSENPAQAGLFAEARLVVDGLTVDGGLRWDTFDPRAVFPVVPGRIFTHPNFDPTDPYDPADSVFAPAASRTALSPRVRVAFDGLGPVVLRLGYAEQARHPDLTAMFTGKTRDLSFSNTLSGFGRPLDWERSRHLEAGVRVAVGSRLAVDAVGFHVAKESDAVLRLETFFDPLSGSDMTIAVPANLDTGSVKGVELTVLGMPTAWLNVQLAYSLADARGTLPAFTNRKQALAGWAVARWPDDAPATSWPSRLLHGGEAAVRFRWSSGLPYWPLINQGFGTVVPPAAFGPARSDRTDGPGVKELDLRVTRTFRTAGVRWGVFADVRNLFNWRNTYRLFAETDGLENDVHRTLLIDPELARLQNEAGAQWIQVTKDGRMVFAADRTGDCAAWSGGPVHCVLLRRAEARWGDGDGFYDVEEARAGFDAIYDLFFGPWALLGPARQARVGVEIRL